MRSSDLKQGLYTHTHTQAHAHTHTHTHSVQEIDISKPHNLPCYVGVHNMGIRALGNRIYITLSALVDWLI